MTVERRTSKHGLTRRETTAFTEPLTEGDSELLAQQIFQDWSVVGSLILRT